MLDRHEVPENRDELDAARRAADTDRQAGERPLADREVPLPGAADARMTPAVQQWLDGDLPEAAARRADERQVEFWARVSDETERRRRMVTPAHVPQRIMDALPARSAPLSTATATVSAATSIVAGRLALSPAMAAAVAAGLLALGFLIGRLV
jgi:hypothetical protein